MLSKANPSGTHFYFKILSFISNLKHLCWPDVPNPAKSSIATWQEDDFKVNTPGFVEEIIEQAGCGRWSWALEVWSRAGLSFVQGSHRQNSAVKLPQEWLADGISLLGMTLTSSFGQEKRASTGLQGPSVCWAWNRSYKGCPGRKTLALPFRT